MNSFNLPRPDSTIPCPILKVSIVTGLHTRSILSSSISKLGPEEQRQKKENSRITYAHAVVSKVRQTSSSSPINWEGQASATISAECIVFFEIFRLSIDILHLLFKLFFAPSAFQSIGNFESTRKKIPPNACVHKYMKASPVPAKEALNKFRICILVFSEMALSYGIRIIESISKANEHIRTYIRDTLPKYYLHSARILF